MKMKWTEMSKKSRLYTILLAVIVLAIIAVVISCVTGRTKTEPPAPAAPAETPAERAQGVKLIEVEKEITTEMLSERLNDVGLLITEEYLFTEVVSYSSVKQIWNIDLGFTESGYIISYDGTVSAGIDFSAIRVEKDDELHRISVYLPRTQILGIDIDPQSFHLYSEKEGLWNPLSVVDYNDSLIQIEANARQKAIDKDVLVKAADNARRVIVNLIDGMIDTSEYSVVTLFDK